MAGICAAVAASCSASNNPSGGTGGAVNGSSTGSGTTSSKSSGSGMGGDNITVGSGGGNPACNSGPNDDADMDGFTPMQGDCNDCDPNVNPDAIDTPDTMDPEAGLIPAADNNCDNKITLDVTCDDNLALADPDPLHAAKAIELCNNTVSGMSWGVIDAKYVGADGLTPRMPDLQTALMPKFGANVLPQAGKSMLGLSSGHMRTPGQPGFCVDPVTSLPSQSCVYNNSNGPAPAGFPQSVPGCAPKADIHDDIALEVKLRAPSNATGYAFNFKFYSFEYPEWVCSNYNDQFIALVNPPPKGAINGNISFDSMSNPVSVNIAFFDVCDPATQNMFACKFCGACPFTFPGNPPCAKQPAASYCPKGTKELLGTGMLATQCATGTCDGGGTSWLQTTAPIKGKDEFTIRFAIWDTGDHNLDSHVIIDGFKWIATGGVSVETKPPK